MLCSGCLIAVQVSADGEDAGYYYFVCLFLLAAVVNFSPQSLTVCYLIHISCLPGSLVSVSVRRRSVRSLLFEIC